MSNMKFNKQNGGFSSLLKEGYKHFGGLEEAILKNIEAVKGLANITRSSLGPNGMNKLVVNHLEKLFLTSDAATIVEELEVVHPAAKMVARAAFEQVKEVGDGSNLVISLAGELLTQAESLLRIGVHPSEIISGYKSAKDRCILELETMAKVTIDNMNNKESIEVRGSQTVQSERAALPSLSLKAHSGCGPCSQASLRLHCPPPPPSVLSFLS